MEHTKKIINDNNEKFLEFDYYFTQIESINSNLEQKPNISIESCKALIEWICKSITKRLDITKTDKELKDMALNVLYSTTIKKLWEQTDIDLDYIKHLGNLIKRLWEIRNNTCDIGHWKSVPNENNNTKEFAYLIAKVTDGLVRYLLKAFFTIDFSAKEEILYDDIKNEEFNTYLDTENEIDWISYSKALYEQDKNDYIQRLRNYNEE